MSRKFAIVDLFAGPGGLAEGFSSLRSRNGTLPFQIELSVEKEATAFQTLRLRSFLRHFPSGFPDEYYQFLNGQIQEPNWSELFPEEWAIACNETRQLELGTPAAKDEIDTRLDEITAAYGGNVVLIGGPPCQAYSLVGRARNMGIAGYKASEDSRHFLYKEYIRIVEKLRPTVFVMENVKGILSSSVDGERVFDRVLHDLTQIGDGAYQLVPLTPRSKDVPLLPGAYPPATDFIVKSEDHSVPQARHRVIVVGVRKDILSKQSASILAALQLPKSETTVTVEDVLQSIPRLRSGFSDQDDTAEVWQREVTRLMRDVSELDPDLDQEMRTAFSSRGKEIAGELSAGLGALSRTGGKYSGVKKSCPDDLRQWLVDRNLMRFSNHETRGHMTSDLSRYFFVSLYGAVTGISPKASNFPEELYPDHQNWLSGKFADRFRVQLWDGPATTITSHISKDGHYFIHPDPLQCRSLTVREAARLQTFPDNYFFKGNRTQQFVQVGNAVPPFLAYKIAKAVNSLLQSS
ncbi:MAG: DNA cytosine methyltransferase [Microcystis aeruginosa Ma_MB_S_20031200_S102D]|nr:MAG: DNA cytosine methyltransferase [Microcystis aeruginosa Ma_MB_S_20031200_S102D]